MSPDVKYKGVLSYNLAGEVTSSEVTKRVGRGLDLCVSPSLHPVSYFKFGQKLGDEVTELDNLKSSF